MGKLSFPPGFRYEVLLVENRREASSRLGKVETGLPTHCALEPELGLSAARNRVFAEAERLDAVWLACLDDDVLPVESWLEAYAEVMKSKPEGRLFHGQYWYHACLPAYLPTYLPACGYRYPRPHRHQIAGQIAVHPRGRD